MAEHLKSRRFRALIYGVGTLLACCVTAPAAGTESLSDPTRPPDAAYNVSARSEAPPAGPVLQSVLVSPKRKIAVISGSQVALGGKYGDFRVVKITEAEVVLHNGKDTQILKLFPQVEKHVVSRTIRPPAGQRH